MNNWLRKPLTFPKVLYLRHKMRWLFPKFFSNWLIILKRKNCSLFFLFISWWNVSLKIIWISLSNIFKNKNKFLAFLIFFIPRSFPAHRSFINLFCPFRTVRAWSAYCTLISCLRILCEIFFLFEKLNAVSKRLLSRFNFSLTFMFIDRLKKLFIQQRPNIL